MPRTYPKRKLFDRFMEKVSPEPNTGCWLWTGGFDPKSGYGSIHLGGRTERREKAHRAAFVLFGGDLVAGCEICHSCDQPACVNPAHLFLGTRAINILDMKAKNRQSRGSGRYCAKLTEDAVFAIRRTYATGAFSMRQFARWFGVSVAAIQHVLDGSRWKHVA